MSDYPDLKLAVDEMNRALKHQFEAIDAHKATARSVLSAASVITGLLGVLQLARPSIQPNFVSLYNFFIIAAMVIYAVLIILAVWSMMAVSMSLPVKASEDTLKDYFLGKDNPDLLKMQLSAILNAVHQNYGVISHQKIKVTLACICLPIIVIILLGLSLVPRV